MSEIFEAGSLFATGYPWMDLLRLGMILVPGIIFLAMAAVLCYKYFRVFLMDQKLSKAQDRKSSWRGLLPIHVAVIAVSHGGLVFMLLTSVVDRFREPLYSFPRTIAYAIFLWLGVVALNVMSTHSKRRAVAIEKISYPKAMGDESGPPPIGGESGKEPPA